MTTHDHALRYTADEYIPAGSIVWSGPAHHFLAVRWHEHDFYELAVVESGTGRHVSDLGAEPVGRGTVIFVPPGLGHGYLACQDMRVINFFFRAELDELELIWAFRDEHLRTLFNPSGLPRSTSTRSRVLVSVDEEAVVKLLGILETIRTAPPVERTRARELAHLLVILDLLATARNAGMIPGGRTDTPAVVMAALDVLERDLAFPWTLDELSSRLYVNPFHLTRLFGRCVGIPPMQYLGRRRLERAAALLSETDQPVASIGVTVGLADPAHFSRRFRASFGLSPRAYRQRHRAEPRTFAAT